MRCTEPRLAAVIWQALGDAASVLNVGAGTGSYEPTDREVIAVEPSAAMIAQRPPGAAPVLRASAEELPLADKSVDVAMAVLTLQHWRDVDRGVRELARVARDRVVLVTIDGEVLAAQWLASDYLPELVSLYQASFPTITRLAEMLPNPSVSPIPVPRDCIVGFSAAFWARPEAYLDPAVRAANSGWSQLDPQVLERALAALEDDLASGRWDARHDDLRALEAYDVGLRLVTGTLTD